VVTALPFRTHKEAIALGNNTAYGLSSSVWTETLGKALDVAFQVRPSLPSPSLSPSSSLSMLTNLFFKTAESRSCLDKFSQFIRCSCRIWRIQRKWIWKRSRKGRLVRVCEIKMATKCSCHFD